MSADLFAAFGNPNPSSGSSKQENVSADSQNAQVDTLGPLLDSSLSFQTASSTARYGSSGTKRSNFPSTERLPQAPGNEVLFDASDENIWGGDDDDEWGDFETAEPANTKPAGGLLIDLPDQPAGATVILSSKEKQCPSASGTRPVQSRSQAPPLVDLLSEDAASSPNHTERQVTHRQKDETKGLVECGLETSEFFSSFTVSQATEDENAEEWGEFVDDFEAAEPQTTTGTRLNPHPSGVGSFVAPTPPAVRNKPLTRSSAQPVTVAKGSAQVRPTNIPPPVILLSLFPPLLDQLQHKCTGYSSLSRNKELAQRSKLPLEIASVVRVMARVLLGRSLRWKRDSILSQSTKIGPARSGKPGGMKLSSVNKNESIKEDKEAVEVQEAWKKRAGFLNSVMTAASEKPVPPAVENLQVRTATDEEGVLKAAHACALCGLKREERISRIDHNVHDSFGEWWTDYWGHSECKSFWEAHSSKLNQR
ncbi:hypothetical protein VTO42DRAFT_94 [Malbranchea cinnamomea]